MNPVRLPTLASLPPPRPDPAQDRFQTDAVFVQRSALDRRLRLCVLDVLGRRGEGVGKAAWAAASMAACRGRGRRGAKPNRRKDTQPKCALTASL